MADPEPHHAVAEAEPESPAQQGRRLRNGLIWLAVLIAILVGVIFAVPNLRQVGDRLSDARPEWVAVGVALELASCFGYMFVFQLVFDRGPRRTVGQLAWAEMAFGSVVPAGGAGGLALGAWVLRARGVSWPRIANRSAVIFLLTSAVNVVVFGLAGALLAFGVLPGPNGVLYGLLPAIVGFGTLGAFLALPVWCARHPRRPGADYHRRRRLERVVHELAGWVRDTQRVAFTPNWRLAGALAYLLCDIATLWASMRAFGGRSPIGPVILAYQVGYLVNVIPVPGGIGILDGGLVGTLALYGVHSRSTTAAVLLYHALALWIPTVIGTLAFVRLRRVISQAPVPASRTG
jgi:uncharacterized membrane protein YbhN (UPF0104 family)